MYKKLNFAAGVLSAGILSSSTEVALKAGHTITTEIGEANKFVGVFFDKTKSSPFQDTSREIVEAHRTDTNTFTIARAKEGTFAKSWVEDDNFMLIASSAVFDEYEEELGYKENVTNKKTTITDSDDDYPTCKAVKTAVDAKQDALGFIPENVANKLTSFQGTPDDTHYPSEKLVKDSLDAKAPSASPTFTGTVTLPKAVNVKDTSADHEYQLGVSELTADRTITLPLLTGNDEFVFKDFHRASSSEINAGTENNKYITPSGLTDSDYRKYKSATIEITVANWNGGTTVDKEVLGLKSTSLVWVSPTPTSYDKYVEFELKATAQDTDEITFTAKSTPDATINVNIIYEV